MKVVKIILVVFFSFLFINSFSQKPKLVKETFKVAGNCDMCKKKIEAAAKEVEGVKTAKWNVVSGKMKTRFNAEITNSDEIQKAIANIGYDTEKYKAKDEVYEKLHHCCKYEREK